MNNIAQLTVVMNTFKQTEHFSQCFKFIINMYNVVYKDCKAALFDDQFYNDKLTFSF